jgi:hypothetical protein
VTIEDVGFELSEKILKVEAGVENDEGMFVRHCRACVTCTCIYLFSECVEALVCTTSFRPTQNPARLIINARFITRMEELNLTLSLLNLPPNIGIYYG